MFPLPIGLFTKTLITAAAVGAVCYGGYVYRGEIVLFYNDLSGRVKRLTSTSHPEKTLSLPSGCSLPDGESKTCSEISPQNMKNINFYEKKGGAITVEGTSNSSLTIEKTNSEDEYPKGFKFSFQNSDSTGITLKKDGNTLFTLNGTTSLTFKVKEEGGIWYLEKKSN